MQSRFPAGILTDFKEKRRGMAEKMQANCVRIISGSVLSIAYPYPAVKQVCRFRYFCTKIKNILLSALFPVLAGGLAKLLFENAGKITLILKSDRKGNFSD